MILRLYSRNASLSNNKSKPDKLQIKSQEDVNLPFERQHWQPLQREEQPPKNNETKREKNAAVTPLYSRHTNSQHLLWTATKTRYSLQHTHTQYEMQQERVFNFTEEKEEEVANQRVVRNRAANLWSEPSADGETRRCWWKSMNADWQPAKRETAKKVETLKTGDERYKIEALTG